MAVISFIDSLYSEKQFLCRLLPAEPDPGKAIANFRACLERINSQVRYDAFLHSGFHVLLRDEGRSIASTMALAEELLKLT